MTRQRGGLSIPLGGSAAAPDGVQYGFAGVAGDDVVLHCWTSDETWTVRATVGVPVLSAGRSLLVSRLLGEGGDRPWIVLATA